MDFPYTSGLTVLAWGIACLWIGFLVAFLNACRKRSALQPLTNSSESLELPKLSVIVAARNESVCIETCIRSLLRQDYPDLEVVAVNDRSTDDTGKFLTDWPLSFRIACASCMFPRCHPDGSESHTRWTSE